MLVILISPPGGGKGTQAELLAKKLGLIHLETSKIIEDKFAEADPNDEIIKKEKEKRLAGELMEPKIIYNWLMESVGNLAAEGKSLILSGSPRTEFEVEKEMPEFDKIFGRENIKIFYVTLSEGESIKRNSFRRMCQANRHPIPNFPEYKDITTCPQDGSPLIIRGDDNPETVKERYSVFLRETTPVLEYFKKYDYPVIEINGEQPIEKVFEDILKKINGDQ